MTYTIREPCFDIKDRACVDECPVGCICEGGRMLCTHPDECVDCAACEPVRPVTPDLLRGRRPGRMEQFTPINAEFFAESVTGWRSPGGAAQISSTDKDRSVIAAWPTVG